MIEQIRHLQSRELFETFALELANGGVIQIHERHLVATTSGTHHVGLHPKVQEEITARMESVRKGFEGQAKHDK